MATAATTATSATTRADEPPGGLITFGLGSGVEQIAMRFAAFVTLRASAAPQRLANIRAA
jgi:hypothetical protein